MKKLLLLIFSTVFCLSMNAKVVLDFTSNYWELPESSSTATTSGTYTNGTYSITIDTNGSNGAYFSSSNSVMIIGKTNATLTLPTMDFDVERIVIVGGSSASTSVVQNIYVGEEAVSTQTTGAQGTMTYEIASDYQKAGTQYVLKITSNHNSQIATLTFYGIGEEDEEEPEPTGHGYEADDPYAVAELIPIIEELASGGTITGIYVEGIISQIDEVSTSYGNMTYYISDDGTTSNQLCIYRGKSYDGNGPSSEDEIQVGDKVIVYGTFVNYQGNTPEGQTGNTQIYSLTRDGETPDPGTGGDTPTGHGYEADDPYTVVELIPIIEELVSGGTITGVYVKGIISQVEEVSLSYSNMTYYISDDGTTTNQLYIYRGKSYDGNGPSTEDEIQVGDEVIVYGTFVNYNGDTPEGQTGNTQIYSLTRNGETVEPGETEPGPEVEVGGLSTFENGGFEEWTNETTPVGWVSTTSASRGTITQSEDAHDGNYSAQVPHSASSNNRLASKEFLLPAGEYNISLYAKAAEADQSAIIEVGYVSWDEDNNGSYNYQQFEESQQITIAGDDWTYIEVSFELEEETKVNLIVMCHQNGECAALVDDYSITSDVVEEDGISAVTIAPAYEGVSYNLAGQKVSDAYKGVVIVNGKKYLKK